MIAKIVKPGHSTRNTLTYLYKTGPGHDHTDPHLVAAFDDLLPDPGRDPDAKQALRQLERVLDLRVKQAGERAPDGHVWHCSIRAAPEDPILSDTQWAQIARRIVHATGIAPEGDPDGCRWIAARHADDHIHIVATKVRGDLRPPRNWNDYLRADKELQKIETEFNLRSYTRGDRTAAKRPTRAETEKAQRTGHAATARERLRATVRTAASYATSEEHFFHMLTGADVHFERRIAPSGDVTGFKVALAGEVNGQQEPVWFSGSTLAPDLSWPKIQARLAAHDLGTAPTQSTTAAATWRQATTQARTAHEALHGDDKSAGQDHLAAVGELLDVLPALTTGTTRAELFAATTAFERATRSRIQHDYTQAAALRSSAKRLLRTAGQSVPDATALDLLLTLVLLTAAASHWHRAQGHAQQAAAAKTARTHLRAAYHNTATPALAGLTRQPLLPEVVDHCAATIRRTLPDHAERILADPAWPALAATLAKADADGGRPAEILTEAADQRELDTAHSIAEVLLWRVASSTNRRAQAATARSMSARPTSSPKVKPNEQNRGSWTTPPEPPAPHRRVR